MNRRRPKLKPCLAWCVVDDCADDPMGIQPGWCAATRKEAREWRDGHQQPRIVRVEIREVAPLNRRRRARR